MFKPFSPQLRIAALAAGFLLILVGILMLRRGSIALGLLLILVGIAGEVGGEDVDLTFSWGPNSYFFFTVAVQVPQRSCRKAEE